MKKLKVTLTLIYAGVGYHLVNSVVEITMHGGGSDRLLAVCGIGAIVYIGAKHLGDPK